MGLSWPHILIVLVLFILLFGRGKISDLMGDVAKGIKSFKQGLADEPEAEAEMQPAEPEVIPPAPKTIEHKQAAPATRTRKAAPAKAKTASKPSGRKSAGTKTSTTRTRNSG